MQVRAQRAGFFGADFKPAGAVFSVPDGTTASWFVPLAASTPAQPLDAGKPQGQGMDTPAPLPKAAKAGAGRRSKNAPAAPEAVAPDSP